jgi:hypothetical protein
LIAAAPLGECTNFTNEVCKAALAHVIEDKAEAAYRRGDLFEKRRELMETGAACCAAPRAGKVVTFSRNRPESRRKPLQVTAGLSVECPRLPRLVDWSQNQRCKLHLDALPDLEERGSWQAEPVDRVDRIPEHQSE